MTRTNGKRNHTTTRWTNAEWLQVSVASIDAVLAGKKPATALFEGQRRVLVKSRHHPLAILQAACRRSDSLAKTSLEKARDMNQHQRDATLATSLVYRNEGNAPPPAPAPEDMTEKKRRNDWNAREWALIARRVDHLRKTIPNLSTATLQAQVIELPPERRRSRSGVYAAVNDGRLEKFLAKGRENAFLCLAAFDPEQTAWKPPTPAPAPEPQAAAADAPSGPPEALPADPEPERPLSPGASFLAASERFGIALAREFDNLMAARDQLILANMEPRIAAMGAEVAALIERGLRSTVHSMLQAELGGPLAPPPKAPPKVDVFAFPSKLDTRQIASVVNGSAQVRFLNPLDAEKYVPDDGVHIILTTDNLPKAARNSIEAAGITPLQLPSSPPKIIAAIRDIAQAREALH